MSKDRELTAEDYRDASRRYKECSSMAVRMRQIGEVAAEFDSFIRSPAGRAALDMLASANKRIEFARVDSDFVADPHIHELDCNMSHVETTQVTGVVRARTFDARSLIETWLEGGGNRSIENFMPWLKAELKKIHDEAPGKPKDDLSELSDEEFGTLERH